jgi:hypothetical protein
VIRRALAGVPPGAVGAREHVRRQPLRGRRHRRPVPLRAAGAAVRRRLRHHPAVLAGLVLREAPLRRAGRRSVGCVPVAGVGGPVRGRARSAGTVRVDALRTRRPYLRLRTPGRRPGGDLPRVRDAGRHRRRRPPRRRLRRGRLRRRRLLLLRRHHARPAARHRAPYRRLRRGMPEVLAGVALTARGRPLVRALAHPRRLRPRPGGRPAGGRTRRAHRSRHRAPVCLVAPAVVGGRRHVPQPVEALAPADIGRGLLRAPAGAVAGASPAPLAAVAAAALVGVVVGHVYPRPGRHPRASAAARAGSRRCLTRGHLVRKSVAVRPSDRR